MLTYEIGIADLPFRSASVPSAVSANVELSSIDAADRLGGLRLARWLGATAVTPHTIALCGRLLPRILGAMLDIAVHGLANMEHVKASELARVADFQRWAMACETAFSKPGAFERAVANNMYDTVEGLIDGEPVAKAIGAFMLARDAWEGTAAELLVELMRHDRTEARVSRSSTGSRDPARLSKALRAMQPTLAKGGIAIEFGKAGDRCRTRVVKLRNRAVENDNSTCGPERPSSNISFTATADGS
jgi:hypothetical protein